MIGGHVMQLIRRLASFRLEHPILSGLWYAFLWMMMGALVLSLLLQWDILEEISLPNFTYIIHGISLFIGGFVAGKRATHKGWYKGAVTGFMYGILLLLTSFLALDSSITWSDLTLLLPTMCISAFGGMIGVNLSRK
jgi:putative membrane protein (TIGR04086 family)